MGRDRGRDMRRESGSELQADIRESEHNERRVSGENGDRGGLNSDQELSLEERDLLDLYEKELGAHMEDGLLGTEGFIDKLILDKLNVAVRILNKIRDLKRVFQLRGDPEARKKYKQYKIYQQK